MLQLTFVMRDTDFAASAPPRGPRSVARVTSIRAIYASRCVASARDPRRTRVKSSRYRAPGCLAWKIARAARRFNGDQRPRAYRKERFRVQGWHKSGYEARLYHHPWIPDIFYVSCILRIWERHFGLLFHARTRHEFSFVVVRGRFRGTTYLVAPRLEIQGFTYRAVQIFFFFFLERYNSRCFQI